MVKFLIILFRGPFVHCMGSGTLIILLLGPKFSFSQTEKSRDYEEWLIRQRSYCSHFDRPCNGTLRPSIFPYRRYPRPNSVFVEDEDRRLP